MLLEKAYIVDEKIWEKLCKKRLKETNELNMINELYSLTYKKNENKYALIDLLTIYCIPTHHIESIDNKINLIFRRLSYSISKKVNLKIEIKKDIHYLNLNKIELTSYPDGYDQILIKNSLDHYDD